MASAAPSIKDKVDAIRRNLGFDDALTITEAVDRACGELELHDLLEQKKPLPERVDKCLEVLGISASDVGPPSGPSHAPPPDQFTPVEPVVVEAVMEEPQMMDDDEPVHREEQLLLSLESQFDWPYTPEPVQTPVEPETEFCLSPSMMTPLPPIHAKSSEASEAPEAPAEPVQ